ncbi:hypothetical protein CALCODRAFT_290742 [Calocera cornea HHB12733]|uniref:Uncharacterized protein n=1 Tax=Calocera cornea HHB12733 TaxID=1353952 RepID=A0A165FSY3_9BASI|nr:hypothetical protein CALCODRAFT_290742 [Calocera cornea HHB12733]
MLRATVAVCWLGPINAPVNNNRGTGAPRPGLKEDRHMPFRYAAEMPGVAAGRGMRLDDCVRGLSNHRYRECRPHRQQKRTAHQARERGTARYCTVPIRVLLYNWSNSDDSPNRSLSHSGTCLLYHGRSQSISPPIAR